MLLLLAFLLLTLSHSVPTVSFPNAVQPRSTNFSRAALIPLLRKKRNSLKPRIFRRDGIGTLQTASGNQEFLAQITLGTESTGLQTFELNVDTGSADTWVVSKDFKCDTYFWESAADVCDPPDHRYSPGQSAARMDAWFNNGYGDGPVSGDLVTESVTIAGLQLATVIGVATSGRYNFGGSEYGILGLGGILLSGMGPDTYDPIFVDMYKQGVCAPYFSLALNPSGGWLGLGAMPDIYHDNEWVKISMPPEQGSFETGQYYKFYNILIDDIVWANSVQEGHIATLLNQSAVIDSGTSAISLPDDVADIINSGWDPPPAWNGEIICDITAYKAVPTLGITVHGYTFYLDPSTLIQKNADGKCLSAVIQSSQTLNANVFGSPFLMNVLAVFDYEHEQMRLASTNRYAPPQEPIL